MVCALGVPIPHMKSCLLQPRTTTTAVCYKCNKNQERNRCIFLESAIPSGLGSETGAIRLGALGQHEA